MNMSTEKYDPVEKKRQDVKIFRERGLSKKRHGTRQKKQKKKGT